MIFYFRKINIIFTHQKKMSLPQEPFFNGLMIPGGDGWHAFEFRKAKQRARAALFALKNFVATNTASYVRINGITFRATNRRSNSAKLVEVIFDLHNGIQVPRDGDSFQFIWSSVEMRPMRQPSADQLRKMAALDAEMRAESYEDLSENPYGCC